MNATRWLLILAAVLWLVAGCKGTGDGVSPDDDDADDDDQADDDDDDSGGGDMTEVCIGEGI